MKFYIILLQLEHPSYAIERLFFAEEKAKDYLKLMGGNRTIREIDLEDFANLDSYFRVVYNEDFK